MKLEFSEKNDRFIFFYLTLTSDILPDVWVAREHWMHDQMASG